MTKHIQTTATVKVDEHSPASATFTVQPLHTGYGMTLGNSLRRVLLSSIAGAAVTQFRPEGAAHEFTTLPGVKEDLVDIMMNLKGLRFRVFDEEPHTLTISKKGKGSVTGADIKTDSNVEVVNPDHVIATLSDAKSNFGMDIVVETGRGYRAIEEGDRRNTEMIAVDAIFTPVLRVRYKVESTRVGQTTDLDKLVLTVDTDGSITPKDAFEEAAAILVNQYTSLAGQTRVETGPVAGGADGDDSEGGERSELDTAIEDLNLSARTTNALINNDINTLKDLFSLSDVELRELKGFGNKALEEVKDKMAELEL